VAQPSPSGPAMWMRTSASAAGSANTTARYTSPTKSRAAFPPRKAISIPFSNAIPQTAVLDVDNCMLCGKCAKVCPTDAVDYFQQPENLVMSSQNGRTGHRVRMTPLDAEKRIRPGQIPNVITALQMERLLAPHGPYNRVIRGRPTAWSPTIDCLCAVCRLPGQKHGGFLLLTGLLHVRHQTGHAALRMRCPWRISPFTTWISAPLVKDTSSSTKMPRPWASNLSKAKSPISRAKTAMRYFALRRSDGEGG
jgi:ferredoxin